MFSNIATVIGLIISILSLYISIKSSKSTKQNEKRTSLDNLKKELELVHIRVLDKEAYPKINCILSNIKSNIYLTQEIKDLIREYNLNINENLIEQKDNIYDVERNYLDLLSLISKIQ